MNDPVVLPEGSSGAEPLRVQSTSKLAFGATTAALVVLASSGTAILVNKGIPALTGPSALPGGSPRPGSATDGPVVVDRAPGTFVGRDATVRALRDALAQRPDPGSRTLVAPLVALDGGGLPVLAPVAPPAVAPVAPPAVAPVDPPAVAPVDPPAVAPGSGAPLLGVVDGSKRAARADKAAGGAAKKATTAGKHAKAAKAAKAQEAARKAAQRAARAQERAETRAEQAKLLRADRRHGGGRHLL